jgi:hypothetical protein
VTIEHFPTGYAYAAHFPDLAWVADVEGGEVYAATDGERPVLITDESTLLEFLDDGDAAWLTPRAVSVHRFATAAERTAYLAERKLLALPLVRGVGSS